MKTLILMRHGKTEFHATTGRDIDRELTQRGISDARSMAAQIQHIYPQASWHIMHSSAARARQTAEQLAPILSAVSKIEDEDLYLAGPNAIIQCLQQMDNGIQHLVLVAHNPGISECAAYLTQDTQLMFGMPTCGTAIIEVNITTWESLSFQHPQSLKAFLSPQ